MKKMYTLLLLMSNVLITSCMQEERPQNNNNSNKRHSDEIAFFPSTSPTAVMPAHISNTHTNKQPFSNVPFVAMQSNWKKLNAIANLDIKPSVTANKVQLTPIYSSKEKIEEKEKNPLLQIVSFIEPDNTDRMQKLYQDTLQFTHTQTDNNLICLIANMRSAKNVGITEDMMGQFAINQAPQLTNTQRAMAPLMFFCLKKYFITIATKQEAIPEIGNSLSNYTPLNILFTHKGINPYPTYLELYKSITSMGQESPFWLLNFFDFLHTLSSLPSEMSSPNSCPNLVDAFYNKASDFLLKEQGLPKLIRMMNNAKESNTIATEQELGRAILAFEPSPLEYFRYLMISPILMPTYYTVAKIKYSISLLCILIEQFNKTRENKKVPSCEHYNCYQLQQTINLTPPDSFNMTLLDNDLYAFTEYEQLLKNAIVIRNAEDENIEQWVNHFYPSKK